MNLFSGALEFLTTASSWSGEDGIPARVGEHLLYTLVAVLIASAIAVPIGFAIGHIGRGRALAVGAAGAARALPTLGILLLIGLGVGIGITAPMISFVILAIPSILAGAYSGFEAVDRATIDSARAVGMSEWQIVTKVELPLGLPLLIGGIRAASLQVVATATLASVVGAGGLGTYIFRGLRSNNYALMLAGSLLVVIIAIVLEIVFSLLQRVVVPAGVRAQRPPDTRERSIRSRPVTATPLQEGTQ
ncbi:ABC transporter permease [Frigoribacterium sp. 2-23]|uniref:ABC transporter permease n=1 Tax=Frigoribacterium sp. 2-23 TaxID=3415006 RepID=UPI003C6F09AB